MALEIAGWAAVVIWVYLLIGRGGFWRMREDRPRISVPSPAPRVTAVIPARNEAAVIGRAVGSLVKQHYPGEFHIVVVDDHSSDGTAEAAGERATVVQSAPLPSGWTGKLWAVAQGVREAARFSPDFLLLTDADIVHHPETVSALVSQATQGYDLVSRMATLHCETAAERALIPAFLFFFFLLYPPRWIRNPRRSVAGAAGGCILIRREMLEWSGGVERIRGELIDDCALAAAVKQAGGRVWLGVSSETESIREYHNFREIGGMISRTAFTQLRHSWWLLAGTLAGLALTYLLPPAAALAGKPSGIVAWLLMSAAYFPALRFYRRSPLWAPLLPLVAAFYAAATIHSALAYARGSGGMWKGRAQAAGQ